MTFMDRRIVIPVLMSAMLASGADAGQLSQFEAAATRWPAADAPSKHRCDESERNRSCLGGVLDDLVGSCIGNVFLPLMTEAIEETTDRMAVNRKPETDAEDGFRYIGDPDLPFIRTDFQYQHVDSQLYGLDGRIEAGYGSWGLQFRHTHYEERKPDDSLGLTGIHGLFRVSWSEKLELGLGLGGILLDGDGEKGGFSATFPVNLYPHRRFSLRFAPAFSHINGNPLSDYDLSVGVVCQCFSLRSGYRWLTADSETINGPYIGVSIHY